MEWKNGNEKRSKKEMRETAAKWCERTHVRQSSLEKNKNKKYHLEKERVIRMKLERKKKRIKKKVMEVDILCKLEKADALRAVCVSWGNVSRGKAFALSTLKFFAKVQALLSYFSKFVIEHTVSNNLSLLSVPRSVISIYNKKEIL